MIRMVIIVVLLIYSIYLNNRIKNLENENKSLLDTLVSVQLIQKNSNLNYSEDDKVNNQNNNSNIKIEKTSITTNQIIVPKLFDDITNEKRKELFKKAYIVAKKHNIDPLLFISLIYTESSFNPGAISPTKRYHGLGQIPLQIYDPEINLELSAVLLKYHLKKANRDIRLAIANYKGYKDLSTTIAQQRVNKVFSIYYSLRGGNYSVIVDN
ncbi:MAG: lytic transglycosylase domain-containing protein [Nitrososphaerota archaeon]